MKDLLKGKILGDYKRGGVFGLYHWVRCHVWNRYHVVNISGMDEYDWGWIDSDLKILYANFRILCDFVEKEDPGAGKRTFADYKVDEEWEREIVTRQLEQSAEIRSLYDWWTETRPKKHREHDEMLSRLTFSYGKRFRCNDPDLAKEYSRIEDELYTEDTEMLVRLMRIRHRLWT